VRHVVQNEGGAVIAVSATKSTHRPLYPKQWNSHEQETNEVRDDERSAAVLNGLNGETQKVTETYGISCHSEDETNA